MISRCWSLLISDVDRGAAAPSFRSQSMTNGGRPDVGFTALSASPITSPRRRSIVVALGVNASAPPAISSDTNRNAIKGRNSGTSHLDLHHATNPEVPDDLHHEHALEHQVSQMLAEERRHVFRVDDRQCDRKKRRQAKKHVSGEPPMRRVHANLALDLETLSNDMREIVENLGEVAARVPLN